jgi:hypothetical protein
MKIGFLNLRLYLSGLLDLNTAMKIYSVLSTVLLMMAGHSLFAQTDQKVEKRKQETVERREVRTDADVKAVPAARNRSAKPVRVDGRKPQTVRPGGTRPARNSRPATRPVRPGSGRN